MDFDPEKHEINELTLLEKHKLVLPNGDTKIGIWFEWFHTFQKIKLYDLLVLWTYLFYIDLNYYFWP